MNDISYFFADETYSITEAWNHARHDTIVKALLDSTGGTTLYALDSKAGPNGGVSRLDGVLPLREFCVWRLRATRLYWHPSVAVYEATGSRDPKIIESAIDEVRKMLIVYLCDNAKAGFGVHCALSALEALRAQPRHIAQNAIACVGAAVALACIGGTTEGALTHEAALNMLERELQQAFEDYAKAVVVCR